MTCSMSVNKYLSCAAEMIYSHLKAVAETEQKQS
jgi:hypothetical protein